MTLKEEQLFLESLITQFDQISNKDNLSRIRKKHGIVF